MKITARPPVVKPRKGRKESGKAPGIKSTKRHPSTFELTQSHMDETSRRHSFSGTRKTSKASFSSKPRHSAHEQGATSSLESPLPKTKDVMELHMSLFSILFHPWIEFIHDTAPDGNCGFRAIAKGLGMDKDEDDWPSVRRHMLQELEMNKTYYQTMFDERWFQDKYDKVETGLKHWAGSAKFEWWFTTPDMGFLAASTYNICIVYLSDEGCITCIPLNKAPNPEREKSILFIGNVNKIHYVHIGVRPNPSIPGISCQWKPKRLEIS